VEAGRAMVLAHTIIQDLRRESTNMDGQAVVMRWCMSESSGSREGHGVGSYHHTGLA
jgi:hypothetical protein